MQSIAWLAQYQRWAVANKIRKLQIRKFANLNNFLDQRTYSRCGNLRYADNPPFLRFADLLTTVGTQFFADLNFHKFANTSVLFWLTIGLKWSNSNLYYSKLKTNLAEQTLRPKLRWFCNKMAVKKYLHIVHQSNLCLKQLWLCKLSIQRDKLFF